MSNGFAVVVGMTIAYAASLIGMIYAWIYYRRMERQKRREDK